MQAGQGTLVANPTTPQECYSNARLYQLRGDTTNALKAYECYFRFNLEFADPFYDYTALLNATQGIAQTRKTIDDMQRARPDSATLELIGPRLLDAPVERIQRLIALAARSPQYGPVFDELGQEYDRAIAGNVTNDLLKRQAETYNTLLKLEENQLLSRYYIDKAQADARLQERAQDAGCVRQPRSRCSVMLTCRSMPMPTESNLLSFCPKFPTAKQLFLVF